jgi:hypothetical protein
VAGNCTNESAIAQRVGDPVCHHAHCANAEFGSRDDGTGRRDRHAGAVGHPPPVSALPSEVPGFSGIQAVEVDATLCREFAERMR